VKQLPTFNFTHYIYDLLEKINVAGTSDDETFSTEHYHLAKVFFNNFLKAKLVRFIRFDEEAFSLSVEGIDFVSCFGVKAGIWEVSFVGSHSLFTTFAHNSSISNIPEEMIMGQLIIIKEINKNFIISLKATGNIRFWKTFIYHCKVIDSKKSIYVKFILFDFFLCSVFFSKCSQEEFTIIKVN
jgi:hypothetical protein